MAGNLREKERMLLDTSYTSAIPADVAKGIVLLPEEGIEGLIYLDIGGGASNFTKWLCDKGAKAFSIDPRYKDLREIDHSLKYYFSRQRRHAKEDGFSPVENKRMGKDYQKAIDEFRIDFKQHRSRYMAGYASSLNFDDESVDGVCSIQTVTTFLVDDPEVFNASIDEELRVLKPGRLLQLHPWFGRTVRDFAFWGHEHIDTMYATAVRLDQAGHNVKVMPRVFPALPSLVVVKKVVK